MTHILVESDTKLLISQSKKKSRELTGFLTNMGAYSSCTEFNPGLARGFNINFTHLGHELLKTSKDK